MTKSDVVLLGGAAFQIYNILERKKAAGNLNFLPGNVLTLDMQGTAPVLTVSLLVQNTSNESFTLKSIAGDVYSNNFWVGNVSYWYPQLIGPNMQSTLKLQIRFGLLGIVQDLISAFQNGNFSQVIDFKANANVDNIQVPIDIKYKLG